MPGRRVKAWRARPPSALISAAVVRGEVGVLVRAIAPPPPHAPGMHQKGRHLRGGPEAVRQAVGGGCQSGWGRLLSVTNAVGAGTRPQGDNGNAILAPPQPRKRKPGLPCVAAAGAVVRGLRAAPCVRPPPAPCPGAPQGLSECCAELLRQKVDADPVDQDGCTPLVLAAEHGHGPVVQQLLRSGAAVNTVTRAGDTALLRAAFHTRAAVCLQLIAAKADCAAADGHGNTALVWAAFRQQSDVVCALIKAKADVNVGVGQGQTLLISQCKAGHDAEAAVLIASGADVRAADPGGRTALHWVAKRGGAGLCEHLLGARASPGAADGQGCTPLLLAAQSGAADVCRLLLKEGAEVDGPDHGGVWAGVAGPVFLYCLFLLWTPVKQSVRGGRTHFLVHFLGGRAHCFVHFLCVATRTFWSTFCAQHPPLPT